MKMNQYRNFIIFWASQTVSQLGSSMTGFALIIWAFKQTNSALTVSLLTFFSYLPYIFVSVFAGSFVDEHKKKNIMLFSDSVAVLCSVGIIVLLITGDLQIWHIYIANTITGFMNAFQSPASSVAIGIMVPKDKLSKASGMSSLTSSTLSVITPMLAAFISSFWGLKGVIIIDILTFGFAFLVLLLLVRIPERIEKRLSSKNSVFAGCMEGFSFLFQNKGLFYLLISIALMNFFSRLTYENILPAMLLARSGGNDKILGIVSGVLGIGGIAGSLYVSLFRLRKNSIKVIYFSAALSFILGDILMGLGQNLWIWSIAGLAASVPIPFINAGSTVVIYNNITTEMQGRIFSARNAVQYATVPIGILLGGILADYVFEPFMQSGSPVVRILQKLVGTGAGSGMAVMFICTGVLGCVTSLFWYKNRKIRELY